MKRRANGEGAVSQRKDGRWEARISLADGRRKCVYGKTQREVLERKVELLRSQQQGLPAANERQTVGAFLESYLVTARKNLRPRTWTRYEQLARVHTGAIARVPLARLGPQHLEQLYAQRLEAGSAPRTVRNVHAFLHKAIGQATTWGLLPRNVVDLVSAPRAGQRDMVTLDEHQARAFLASAAGERLEALFVLALSTGMRQGELLALRWSDVDLEHASAHVQQSVQFVRGGGWVFTAPKTKKSRRKVELTAAAVAALRRHRTQQLQDRLATAGGWEDLGLVFANELGRPMSGRNLAQRSFTRILEAARLPAIRFHDLRHTAATLLLGRGVHPKVVSEMLGHATIAITLDLYSHVIPTMQREAASVFDSILAGGAR